MKAYPGIELICHELNISENRFHKHKKQLIDHGYMSVTRERKERDGAIISTGYKGIP